ncbi:MAG: hypothetical protein PUB13_10500 [Lachnospiraceae bacterium]|nr:hypothetical protein [Lachnospiraceae bacterium]
MKKTPKQIAALIGASLLVLLYVLTLVFAVFDFPHSESMFRACLYGTIAIPLFTWIIMFLCGKISH